MKDNSTSSSHVRWVFDRRYESIALTPARSLILVKWGVPKIRGAILGVAMIRTLETTKSLRTRFTVEGLGRMVQHVDGFCIRAYKN